MNTEKKSKTHYDGLVDQASKDKYNSSSGGTDLSSRDMDVSGWPDSFRWAPARGPVRTLRQERDRQP